MGCDKCEGGFVFTRCCAGLSEMCGCGGLPYKSTNCKACNPNGNEPEDENIFLKLAHVESEG